MSDVEHVTHGAFLQTVATSDAPVIVDFWAESCPPCRALAPVSERLAGHPELVVAKSTPKRIRNSRSIYGVHSIPTAIRFDYAQPTPRAWGPCRTSSLRQVLRVADETERAAA